MDANGEKVAFPSKNPAGDGQGMVFGDPTKTPKGLIVIHEWWGMTEQIAEQGEAMAKAGGFTVLVVDVYRGRVADDREEAGHIMSNLDFDAATEDIIAGAEYLISRGCNKVGVTGFCMGGALAFLAGLHSPPISAIAPFYGIPQNKERLAQLKVPVQAHFGLQDTAKGFSSPEEFLPLKALLEAGGVDLDFHAHDAPHAFTNHSSPNYNKEIAEKALNLAYAFFQQKLV